MSFHGHTHDHDDGHPLTTGQGDLPTIVAEHPSGARLVVYLHGATITSFKTPAGQELLLLSQKAVFDGVKPIRGGIPIAFPQFAGQGPLPMHGFARTSKWKALHVGAGHVELGLSSSDETKAIWPHDFSLRYRIDFDETHLTCALEVTNPENSTTGPFAFEALLHGYFALAYGDDSGGIERARIHGLGGVTYLDKPAGKEVVQEGDSIRLGEEVDRIYMNTPADVKVEGIVPPADLTGKPYRSFTVKRKAAVRDITAKGRLTNVVQHAPLDVVVWNPGAHKAAGIVDLQPGQWKQYVCVEPGRVSKATADFPAHKALEPGHAWTITQIVELHYD